MRIGIRKTEYLSSPYERKDLKSTSAWDLDICNLIRYGNCKKAYNAANKVHILKENLIEMSEEKKIQMLKTEIQIMLEILEESELQVALTKIYNENKSPGLNFLHFFLDSLTTGNYNFIFNCEPSQ